MCTRSHMRVLLMSAVCLTVGAGCAPRVRWSLEPQPVATSDTVGVTVDPEERDPSLYWDAINQSSLYLVEQSVDLPRQFRKLTGRMHDAVNADVFGEVPNSSWFTNRHGTRRLTREELQRGPDRINGPDTSGLWIITRAKTQGVTPGFFIKDARGETFVLKFDPKHHPELATGAELASTKLFHALGYNVPENYLVQFDPRILTIKEGLKYKDERGRQQDLTSEILAEVLERIEVRPDGRIRATASRLLPGRPLGPFSYKGRRKDDPNDLIPHEHRRELRALRVFSQLVNNFDTKDHNTLDILVDEGGRKFVRHYLIDFSSALGSDSDEPKAGYKGYSYTIDAEQGLVSLVTLGMRRWSWEYADQSGMPPAAGYFESELFEPDGWKPLHANPAFDNMLDEDAFWACRILGQFTRDDFRACLETAQYSDPATTDYLVEQLWARRTKILAHYYAMVCPLDDVRVADDGTSIVITYTDRRVIDSLLGGMTIAYDVRVTAGGRSLVPTMRLSQSRVELDSSIRAKLVASLASAGSDADHVLEVRVSSMTGKQTSSATAYVYFDAEPTHTRLVGLSRDD